MGVLPEKEFSLPGTPVKKKKAPKTKGNVSSPKATPKKATKKGLSDEDVDIINDALDTNILTTGSSSAAIKKPASAKKKKKQAAVLKENQL